jgi:putative solute:sodium symporter small subunit
MSNNSSHESSHPADGGGRTVDDGERAADDAATDGGRTTDDAATDGGRTTDDAATDGGVATGAAQKHRQTDYLTEEVNLLKPSTAYMRDHLRIVWTGFIVWAVIVFGPVTMTLLAPGTMTTTMPVLGFPWHYFLVAFGAPTGSLILAAVYARQRDKLDDKYGIDHNTGAESADTVTDGGRQE